MKSNSLLIIIRKILFSCLLFSLIACVQQNNKQLDSNSILVENVDYSSKFEKKISNKNNVALLLPIQNNENNSGKAMYDMAEFTLLRAEKNKLNLLFLDINSNSEAAKKQLNEIFKQNIKLIIGPLLYKTTEDLKDGAISHNINLISLSNNPALANQKIFSIGHIVDDQIKKIADFAIKKDITQFYTLLPANSYGQHILEIMRSTITNNNALIEKAEFYTNNENEIDIAIKNIIDAINSPTNSSSITKPALLIAEGGVRLRKILTILDKYKFDYNRVQILGSGQWDDEEIFALPQLNNSWFVSNYSVNRKQIQEDFFNTYGYQPPRLAYLVNDAISIALTLDKKNDFSKTKIMDKEGFAAADGIIKFRDNGLAERHLSILEINNKNIEIIN